MTVQPRTSPLFIKKYKEHDVYGKQVVIIFDECHRSQFGDMHLSIIKHFKQYYLFGFTGTPIFSANAGAVRNVQLCTTEQTFGDKLHTYTIVDAINDNNVLPFHVDYLKTMDADIDIDDKQVWDIDREKAFMAPERIKQVTAYILDHFNQKTYRGEKTYDFRKVTNIKEVASAERGKIDEIKEKQRVSGFNSIFAVSSIVMKYHDTHCEDKEILIAIQKAIDSSPNLRSKKALIEGFIAGINDVDDIMSVWHEYVAAEREAELVKIIAEENLKETETRKYIASVFRNGELKTSGTDIDKIMKPMSRFGGSNRAEKKQAVIKRITDFFERFFGIGGNDI